MKSVPAIEKQWKFVLLYQPPVNILDRFQQPGYENLLLKAAYNDKEFKITPSSTTVAVNVTVFLNCSGLGGPGNTYQWSTGQITPTLQLNVTNGTSDGGTYTCVVTNAAGSGSASATVYVTPTIITQPSDVLAVVNGNVTLRGKGEDNGQEVGQAPGDSQGSPARPQEEGRDSASKRKESHEGIQRAEPQREGGREAQGKDWDTQKEDIWKSHQRGSVKINLNGPARSESDHQVPKKKGQPSKRDKRGKKKRKTK
ncbi:hypothetical protein EMCRGX_G003984 [Ephydatia muelleri]